MNLPAVSIARPVTTLMIVALIAAIGLVSLVSSSTDLLPEIAMPIVAVVTNYSGAGAREVEALISRPIEQVLGYVGGVERISSDSSEGTSVVMAELGWGTNLDAAVLDVRDSIELIKPYLPDGAGNPRIVKADLSMMPMIRLALSGPYDTVELTRFAETVQSRIERVEGVASATIGGGVYEEVRVEVDPANLLRYGLSVPGIANVLRTENLNLPGGRLDEAGRRLVIRTQGQYLSVQDIARTALATPAGAVVYLSDVASVELVRTERSTITRISGQPAVTLAVRKQSSTNTVEVAREVRSVLAGIGRELPAGVEVRVIQDQSDFINRALRQVTENILVGGALAIIVLYLFLVEVRTVLVIAMAIPASILATFAFMYFTGLTLNLVSLGGLALGVGMLVDNAVVILENIYRHREAGSSPREAAARGTQEVAMAVSASTLTTVVVFVPVVFVKGLASQIFRQLAMTVSFSLASSLFVALTFVPMAASLLLRAKRGQPGRVALASGRVQEQLVGFYRRTLVGALARRWLVMAGVGLVIAMAVLSFYTLPRNLLPSMDQREVGISVKMAKATSPTVADGIMREVEAVILARTDVDYVYAGTGGGAGLNMFSSAGADGGEVVIRLLPRTGKMPSTSEAVRELRRAVANVPGAEFQVTARSSIVGEDRAFGAPLVVTVRGDDLDVLAATGDEIAELMRQVPGVVNVKSKLEQGAPELQITVDRVRAAAVGLSGAQVGTLVRAAVEGQVATSFRWDDRDVDIRVVYPEGSRRHTRDIESLLLMTPAGKLVRLDEVAQVSMRAGPTAISRQDGARITQVEAELAGIDLDTAMARVKAQLAALPLPAGYVLEFGGESKEIGNAFGSLGQSMIMAVFLVYMVMAAQFESLRQPVIIMVTLPLALAGAIVALAVTGQPMSVPSIVGLIALAGVVVNNGIVLVDYTNQLRAGGLGLHEALVEASAVRLRPILMTSLTTIIALLPMVLTSGEGNELLRSLSMPLLGGMALSTLLTLLVVPALYTLVEPRDGRLGAMVAGEQGVPLALGAVVAAEPGRPSSPGPAAKPGAAVPTTATTSGPAQEEEA